MNVCARGRVEKIIAKSGNLPGLVGSVMKKMHASETTLISVAVVEQIAILIRFYADGER